METQKMRWLRVCAVFASDETVLTPNLSSYGNWWVEVNLTEFQNQWKPVRVFYFIIQDWVTPGEFRMNEA